MVPFLGIVRLTLKTAVRSNIFQLLLLVLLVCIVALPATISGDGTAQGYIQISLKYSLAVTGFVLSLSSVWLGCFIMSRDTETYQLHMVATKSISRVTIWLGKWAGIVLIHLVLLLVASLTIYFIVQYQYHRQEFSAAERQRIQNEVMVARRVYYPVQPNMDELARRELARRIEVNKRSGRAVDESQMAQDQMYQDIKREIVGSYSQIPYGGAREWQYKNLPTDYKGPVFLRFRFYVAKIGGNEQRASSGLWIVGIPFPAEEETGTKNITEQKEIKEKKYNFSPYPTTQAPEQIMSGEFHERLLNTELISPNGEMLVAFQNFDPSRETMFFQLGDGPKVLISAGSFTDNYFRAVLVVFIQLLIMAGLGCAAASVLSMPTAVFLVISYIISGSLAVLLSGTTYFSGAADYVGSYMGKILLLFIIPLQAFDISYFVAGGELIEFSVIGMIFLQYFILRGVPFFLLGMFLYRRRELGLVIRK
jgi:hypothetical protein